MQRNDLFDGWGRKRRAETERERGAVLSKHNWDYSKSVGIPSNEGYIV